MPVCIYFDLRFDVGFELDSTFGFKVLTLRSSAAAMLNLPGWTPNRSVDVLLVIVFLRTESPTPKIVLFFPSFPGLLL